MSAKSFGYRTAVNSRQAIREDRQTGKVLLIIENTATEVTKRQQRSNKLKILINNRLKTNKGIDKREGISFADSLPRRQNGTFMADWISPAATLFVSSPP